MLESSASDSGLITGEVAARLLMVEPREIERLNRKHWLTPEAKNPTRYRLVAVVQGYLRYLEHERTRGWTVKEVANDLGITERRFSQLVADGVFPRSGENGYDISQIRVLDRKRLEAAASGRGDGGGQLATERARLAREQGDAIAIKNAVARGDFVPLAQLTKKVSERNSVVRERLLTISGKIADACAMRTREEIEEIIADEIEEVLNELAEPGTYKGVQSTD